MDELKRLAGYVSRFQLADAPPKAIEAARYCVLDTVGSALGAVSLDEVPRIVYEISQWVAGPSVKSAAVWGYPKKSDVFSAALLNGMMGHALELDDVHTGSKTHVGVAVIPAAWAVAEAIGASGRDFLAAVIAGYEAMGRIGMGLDVVSHRKRGFHATGIAGTFGAAAAAARLLRLSADETLSALGMAGTQSSGLWAFLAEGSSCKKLHPGRAAASGLTAAILAKAGMTGPSRILDAEDGGLYRAVSDSFDMGIVCKNLGSTFEILNIDKKPYPCCRSTHPAIDAALHIRAYGVNASDIEKITVDTYEVGVLQCGSPNYPSNGVEAKFSTAFAAAAAFVSGRVTQEQFLPQALEDPVIKSVAAKVSVRENPLFSQRYPKRWGCRMTVTLKDGSVHTKQVDDMSGSVNAPLTKEQEKDKFMGLAVSAFETDKATKLMESILAVDTLKKLPGLS